MTDEKIEFNIKGEWKESEEITDMRSGKDRRAGGDRRKVEDRRQDERRREEGKI